MDRNALPDSEAQKSTLNKLHERDIELAITRTQFYVFPHTCMTVCCLTLHNGYTVIGQAACVDPAVFERSEGQRRARADAVVKVWALEGYRLKEWLMTPQASTAVRVAIRYSESEMAPLPTAPAPLDPE